MTFSYELLEQPHSTATSAIDQTGTPDDDKPSAVKSFPRFWTPGILRRTPLAAFLVTYLAIAITLPILYSFSERNHGLSTSDPKYHYLWTYGPTAAFTIIAVFWTRLEYRCKQLIPWKIMQEGYAPADQTIFLDYISAWSLKLFYQSVRNSHYMVALPVLGNFLLTLMIIFSTGLFSLQEVTQESHVPITQLESFNSLNANLNATRDGPWAVSYGVQYMGLKSAYGTTENHVFPRFNISSSANHFYAPNDRIQAEVDIFTFDMVCETANVTISPQEFRLSNWYTNLTLSTPSCSTTRELSQLAGPMFGSWSAEDLNVRIVECNDKLRVEALVSTVSPAGIPTQVEHDFNSNETVYYEFTGVACNPEYNMSHAMVSYEGMAGTPNFETYITLFPQAPTRLPGISSSDFLSSIWRVGTLDMMYTMFNEAGDYADDKFRNASVLKDLIRTSHNTIGVQIARETLLEQTETIIDGSIMRKEQRLVVRVLSFALLEAINILLAGIVVALFFISPNGCPRNPGLIGGIATILARSEEFKESLRGQGAASEVKMREAYQGSSFCTVVEATASGQPQFIIRTSDAGSSDSLHTTPPMHMAIRWWRPFSASITSRAVVLLAPLAVIVILEVLHRKSQSFSGIAEVSADDKYLRYTWVYIPALLMIMIRLTFESAAFTLKLFQPYSNLRRGGFAGHDTLLNDELGKTSLQNFWDGIRLRRASIAAISVTMFLVPFLTIVVSGLYTLETQHAFKDVQVKRSSVWALRYVLDGELQRTTANEQSLFAQRSAAMILTANLSYPQWTYGPYVFPKISLENSPAWNNRSSGNDNLSDSTVSVRVPALRSDLNCTEVPSDLALVDFDYKHFGLNTTLAIPETCPFLGFWWCSDNKGQSDDIPLSPGDYFDCYTQGWVGRPLDANQTAPEYSHCPTVGYAFGRLAAPEQVEGLNILHCRPYVEQVDVNARFNLPNFDIDSTQPPQAVESTAKHIFDAYLRLGAPDPFLNITVDVKLDRLNSWFKAMISGLDGTPAPELLGHDNIDNLKKGVQRVLGLQTVQVLNAYAHSTMPSDEYGWNATTPTYFPTYAGSLTSSEATKLVQSTTSTRILQALLGVMIVCAIFAFIMQDTRRVLPKNPCSIAAISSLLAGSLLLHEEQLPPGSEYCSDKELANLLGSKTASMGWWARGEEVRFGIDVGMYDGKDLKDLPQSGEGTTADR